MMRLPSKNFPALMLLAHGLLASTLVCAAGAHEHGAVNLNVAVEGGKITLQMESPLENLLGFERAPRTDAERKSTAAMLTRLKAADTLFKIDPAAQCALASVELNSAALKLGTPEPAAASGEHADLDATFVFTCQAGAKAGFIDVAFFDAFQRMRRIEVQVVTDKGQFKRTLRDPLRRILIGR